MIEHYDFGKIRIDGEEYTQDIIVSSDGVDSWWRKDSHWVGVENLGEIIERRPKKVIFGIGFSGVMEVSDEAKEYLKKLGVEVIIKPTKKACDDFNKLSSENENVIAALHLTC